LNVNNALDQSALAKDGKRRNAQDVRATSKRDMFILAMSVRTNRNDTIDLVRES
jgi:hypothetical protein